MWVTDKSYSDLMRELWGSPGLWSQKKTYVEIARKLGVDEETVRNSVKYMKENGFLLGWRLLPNPSLLGLSSYFVFLEFENPEAKEEAIPTLAKFEGVTIITSIYGNSLLITVLDDNKMTFSKRLCEVPTMKSSKSYSTQGMAFPGLLQLKVTKTDWQIMKLLLRDAEKNVSEIARTVKLSTKTVNRRLNELMNSRAIFIMPRVNLRKSGGISYHLLVETAEDKISEVEQLVAERVGNLVFRASASKNDQIFGFNGTNIAEGNDLLKWVKRLPQVRSAKMNIIEHVVSVYDWLQKEVASRASNP